QTKLIHVHVRRGQDRLVQVLARSPEIIVLGDYVDLGCNGTCEKECPHEQQRVLCSSVHEVIPPGYRSIQAFPRIAIRNAYGMDGFPKPRHAKIPTIKAVGMCRGSGILASESKPARTQHAPRVYGVKQDPALG